MTHCANPMREIRHARGERQIEKHELMETAILTMKHSLFVLLGIIALAGVTFSSTIPKLRSAGQEDDGAVRPAVVPASSKPVSAAETQRHGQGKASNPKLPASKPTTCASWPGAVTITTRASGVCAPRRLRTKRCTLW
jgi:hypothetical protein